MEIVSLAQHTSESSGHWKIDQEHVLRVCRIASAQLSETNLKPTASARCSTIIDTCSKEILRKIIGVREVTARTCPRRVPHALVWGASGRHLVRKVQLNGLSRTFQVRTTVNFRIISNALFSSKSFKLDTCHRADDDDDVSGTYLRKHVKPYR